MQAWFAVCDDVANNDLITQLYQEAENVESCAEGLMLWIDAGMSYEIRLVKDEEALLEKREVVTCNLEEEDTAWVEKWVGGEGSHSVRTFVAFALMGESEDLEDIVDHGCGVCVHQLNLALNGIKCFIGLHLQN